MVHKKYLPQTTDAKLTHLIEECAEVISIACKIKRFGIFNYHPDHPDVTNLDNLQLEIEDLNSAYQNYMNDINEILETKERDEDI